MNEGSFKKKKRGGEWSLNISILCKVKYFMLLMQPQFSTMGEVWLVQSPFAQSPLSQSFMVS